MSKRVVIAVGLIAAALALSCATLGKVKNVGQTLIGYLEEAEALHAENGDYAAPLDKALQLWSDKRELLGVILAITGVFLISTHGDPAHLVNNLIVQLAAGTILEKRIGHIRYAVVYVLSGLVGNLASVGADWLSGSYGYSVGASGAVFGVLGALIFLITRMTVRSLRRQKHSSVWYQGGGAGSGDRAGRKYRSLLLRTGIMTAYLVYSGWSNPVINQAAHIGGLVCGFILCAVLMMTRPDVDLNELLQ